MRNIFLIFLFFLTSCYAQQNNYSVLVISKEMTENANSVIRFQNVSIDITSIDRMKIAKTKVVTVLNEKGLKNVDALEYYDNSTKVKSIEATILDAFGNEIKSIKKKDFKDNSVADGFSIYNDNRILYLDYKPINYPVTIVYNSEIETINTAFIPKWFPIDDYYESVEESKITIKYLPEFGFKYKEKNFDGFSVLKEEKENSISFKIENLQAKKYEELSPVFSKVNPSVLFGLDAFSLEGVKGNAKDWDEFSSWIYNNLLKDSDDLSQETIKKVKEMVGEEVDPIKKAKIIYEYLQSKSRYVSIQMGIGGWKPMNASDVDRLGYGDCKALTNYTRVLLKHVGVESFYTLVYAGNDKQNIADDFVSMQGNHAILSIPTNEGYTFLECTNTSSPFGYNGDFTDDRDVLIVKKDGGEIVRTTNYNVEKSKQITKGEYQLNENGSISAKIKIISSGTQYNDKYWLIKENQENKELYYKKRFDWLNNISFSNLNLINDSNNIQFIEELTFNAENYFAENGSIILTLNAFNRNSFSPRRYRNRTNSFEIDRGFLDEDEIVIKLPENYIVDALPNKIFIEEKFGKYEATFEFQNANIIKYCRKFTLNNGYFDQMDYEDFRIFIERISKADNTKIVITLNK